MKKPNIMFPMLRSALAGDWLDAHNRLVLLTNARLMRTRIEQIVTDADHWNQSHPAAAMDVDPDGELRQMADELDAFLLREQPRPM